MSLDVTTHIDIRLVHTGPPADDEWDRYRWFLRVAEYGDRMDGVNEGTYETKKASSFRVSTFGDYNLFRNMLAMVGMGAQDQEVWSNPREFRGRPFWEQVDFSDCEGNIGPETSAKLARDYEEQREAFKIFLENRVGGEEALYYLGIYESFALSFKLAAEGHGLVSFH